MSLKKKKKGWYLEIKHNEKDEDYSTIIEIIMRFTKDTEKVTSKALKMAMQAGVFHNLSNPQNMIVHLNYYKNNIITGRYQMIFNDKKDVGKELIGHFKEWEYYTVDETGNTEPYKYSYSPNKAFRVPIYFGVILILLAFANAFWIPSSEQGKIISGFSSFYLMLVYSFVLLLNKDIAKNHFIKGKYKSLVIATFIFEFPYWVATFISICKISTINNQLNYCLLLILCGVSYFFLILKLWLSIVLENEKMKI
ncbi:hypothetical protein CN490_22540 [Bacillus cereus]|nr:hypothetical protein CN490_22540 [Bacillus cereus]